MQWLLKKIIGTKNERDVQAAAAAGGADQRAGGGVPGALRGASCGPRPPSSRQRLAGGRDARRPACARPLPSVKNACRRLVGTTVEVCGHELTWDMVPFDVQLIGGIVLHQGKIAEMATGEGKTLVATMPALPQRPDRARACTWSRSTTTWPGATAQWMGARLQLPRADRGLHPEPDDAPRSGARSTPATSPTAPTASSASTTCATRHGLSSPKSQVQRGYYYAIIDEVDSILIDEARTPLIISGPAPYSVAPVLRAEARGGAPRPQAARPVQPPDAGGQGAPGRGGERGGRSSSSTRCTTGMPKHKQLLHMLEDPADPQAATSRSRTRC